MKKNYLYALMFCAALLVVGCSDSDVDEPQIEEEPDVEQNDEEQNDEETEEEEPKEDLPLAVYQLDREPWSYENPMESVEPSFSVTHSRKKLEFYGWGLEEDSVLELEFPESTEKYTRAILNYQMGGWTLGLADWDMTTQIMLLDKESGEYYEISRAFTPYGNGFVSTWTKNFYIDVTEYLPLLTGDVEFRVWYGGWDATTYYAHSFITTYDFYIEEEEPVTPKPIYHAKIYDSRNNHNGYRGWYYGSPVYPIEDDTYLGLREFTLPEGVESLLMRVNITGHGMEQGTFPDRDNYSTKNAAEFDENTYEVVVNGELMGVGDIFYSNADTYEQAGTYRYDRANWGPGLPAYVHFWQIDNVPSSGEMSIDLNLENYISTEEEKSIAYYIVQVDLFGYAE